MELVLLRVPGGAQSSGQVQVSAPCEKAALLSSYLQRICQWSQFVNPGLIPLTKKHEVLRAFHHNYQNSSQLSGISMFGNLMDSQRVAQPPEVHRVLWVADPRHTETDGPLTQLFFQSPRIFTADSFPVQFSFSVSS